MRVSEPALVVRPARPVDVPALGRIWLELMDLHAKEDPRFALADDGLQRWQALAVDMLGRDDGFLQLAQLGRPVGFCLGWIARNPPIYRIADVGFVSEIAVQRSLHRRGIGRALMASARRWFAAHNLDEFQLSTAVWNHTAQQFWQAIGGTPLLTRYRFSVQS